MVKVSSCMAPPVKGPPKVAAGKAAVSNAVLAGPRPPAGPPPSHCLASASHADHHGPVPPPGPPPLPPPPPLAPAPPVVGPPRAPPPPVSKAKVIAPRRVVAADDMPKIKTVAPKYLQQQPVEEPRQPPADVSSRMTHVVRAAITYTA